MSLNGNICLYVTPSFRFLKKMCYFSIQVPIELGYDNYITNEDAGLGSQLWVRSKRRKPPSPLKSLHIQHFKVTSDRRQQIIFFTHE